VAGREEGIPVLAAALPDAMQAMRAVRQRAVEVYDDVHGGLPAVTITYCFPPFGTPGCVGFGLGCTDALSVLVAVALHIPVE
jgi:hypothetical protein